MQKVQANDIDNRSGSGVSDLDNLENDTDTLGRVILRHERDARRIQSLLHGSQPALDRSTTRQALVSRLQSRGQHKEQVISNDAIVVQSRSSYDVEPGLNVPRAWGRKTRSSQDWTRASRIPVSTVEKDTPEKRAVPASRVAHVDWEDRNAEHDTPPSMRRRRQLAQPTSLRTMNPRLQEIVKAKHDDFSDLSLLASTPAGGKIGTRREATFDDRADIRSKASISTHERINDSQPQADPESSSGKENVPQQNIRRALQPLRLRSGPEEGLRRRDQLRILHNRNVSGPVTTLPVTASSEPVLTERNGDRVDLQQGQVIRESGYEPPTPMVTGGWIDTPKINKQTEKTSLDNSKPPGNITGPTNIMSSGVAPPPASANLLEQPGPAPADIAQSTKVDLERQSLPPLQAAVLPDKRSAETKSEETKAKSEAADYVVVDKPNPASVEEQPQGVARDALDKHITDALIAQKNRPADQALRKRTTSVKVKDSIKETAPRQIVLDANGRTVCEHCGGLYNSVWRGLWVEFRSNFWTRDPTARFGIRLTRLGTIIFVWLCWYIVESILCFQYCHPRVAFKMVGYGVNPNAPDFPFVIPTLLFRPFAFAWRPALKWLSWALTVVFNWVMGIEPQPPVQRVFTRRAFKPSTRFAWKPISEPEKWWRTAATVAATPTRRAVESAIEAVDDIGRML